MRNIGSGGEYQRIDTAPTTGMVIMALCGRRYPEAVYYSQGAWHFWNQAAATACNPDFWTDIPANPPSDYMQGDVATP